MILNGMGANPIEVQRPGPQDLQSDAVFNADHPLVLRHLHQAVGDGPLADKMARWYTFVRDAIRYDPFAIELSAEANAASQTLANQRGHCVHKSVLFATGLRAMGVPARIGLARVRNHLGTAKLERLLGTDVLTPHGYAAHWNGARWVKSTPVFNSELCERLGTAPLQWTPDEDSQFQPLDQTGRLFMEYLEDYGTFATLPGPFLREALQREYPHCFDEDGQWRLPQA